MGSRRKAREFALQVLYQIDINQDKSEETLKSFWENIATDPDTRSFAELLIRGYINNSEEIDNVIAKYSEHWDIKRIATVDRNILRFSIYELLFCDDIPTKVSINEAVDIGKKYSGEDSGAFINGILDRMIKEKI